MDAASSDGVMESVLEWERKSQTFFLKKLAAISTNSTAQRKLAENRGRVKTLFLKAETTERLWTEKITSVGYKVTRHRATMAREEEIRVEPLLELVYNNRAPFAFLHVTPQGLATYPESYPLPAPDVGTPGVCPVCAEKVPFIQPHLLAEIRGLKPRVSLNVDGYYDLNLETKIPNLFTRPATPAQTKLLASLCEHYPDLKTPRPRTVEDLVTELLTKAENVLSLCHGPNINP
uniref:ORF35 n=1 Tax=Latid herpesvirus 1 TaxID=3096545 RepID=A0AB33V991_9VIRU